MMRPHPQFVPPVKVLDSVNSAGDRLTTFKLRYPKMVHGDFMTHRVFSRNASSSRAIPNDKLSLTTEDDTYVPDFRTNKRGMQPGPYLPEDDMDKAQAVWRDAAAYCLASSRRLSELGAHKQWANRMIEWFGYINVLVSSTSYNNFIGLREELDGDMMPMAQDEIYWQACGVRDLLRNTMPTPLPDGAWHMPFVHDHEWSEPTDRLLKISSARCASISYETVDGKVMDYDRALIVFNKLVTARRMHASPMEHQACSDPKGRNLIAHGNLRGWVQHRKLIPGECIEG